MALDLIGELDIFLADGERVMKLREQVEPMHAFNRMMELVGGIAIYIVDKISIGLFGGCQTYWFDGHLLTDDLCG